MAAAKKTTAKTAAKKSAAKKTGAQKPAAKKTAAKKPAAKKRYNGGGGGELSGEERGGQRPTRPLKKS
jgi:hypothetical protein